MKGTIVSLPSADKMGTIKDKESGIVNEFEAGFFEKLSVGENFRYREMVQVVGDKEKVLRIIKKRIPR